MNNILSADTRIGTFTSTLITVFCSVDMGGLFVPACLLPARGREFCYVNNKAVRRQKAEIRRLKRNIDFKYFLPVKK